jgi:DNA gyrase subunit A
MSDVEPNKTPEKIVDLLVVDEMQDSYLTYAMSVIMSRALPDVRDGLKPSQRRILMAMKDLNLGPRAQHRKCAKISGDTSGNYHPHGDQVIYPTMVRLAQPFNLRYPLIDGQGNFGSIDGDPPAAMRYTEARMTHPGSELMEDIDQETVDFVPNFDETREEPTVLPSKFPNLLVNGSTGIAVGMATNIPPHNLREMCDAIVKVMDEPSVEMAELMQILPGPDFPTGGTIRGRRGIVDAYTTGRGSLQVRGKMHIEERRGGRESVIIDEIPYGIMKTTIVDKLVDVVKQGMIKDVSDIRDESDRRNPIRVVIELKKDGNAELVINQIYQYTPLQSNFHVMYIAVVNLQPKTLGIKEAISHFIDHRKEVIRRRTAYLLRKARQRAHVLEGLILAIGDIDAIIQLIKESSDPKAAKQHLMDRPLKLAETAALRQLLPTEFIERASGNEMRLSGTQADAILSMQLQRLTGLEIEKLAKEYAELSDKIREYEAILRDENLVIDIIREDLYEIKEKYGDARRTEIVDDTSDFTIEELIPDEQVIVTVSHEGYVKRVAADTYRKQGRGGRGVRGSDAKEGDFLEHLFVVSTHDYLLFFTNRGKVYWLKVYDIPAAQRTSRGRSIANLLQMAEEEEVRAILPIKQFEERFVFFSTARGIVKKTPLGAFSRPRPSGIIAISLDEGDMLIDVGLTSGEDQIVLGSRSGMAVRFKEEDTRAMGRTARGVKGMNLKAGDEVVDMVVTREGESILTVCENGFGKRTALEEYRLTRRGGKGVINIKVTERNGKVVALKAVEDNDELIMITAKGIMLRTDLSQLREIGRATQGVRVIRPDPGDEVVAVAKMIVEEAENGGEEGEQAEPREAE